uniref:Uncharacterized protein n=1 Tax=Anguilla anguilla TaxID=7936 RepID=A0A0E9XXB3_ANGAN
MDFSYTSMHEIKASRSINVTEKGNHWNQYNNTVSAAVPCRFFSLRNYEQKFL